MSLQLFGSPAGPIGGTIKSLETTVLINTLQIQNITSITPSIKATIHSMKGRDRFSSWAEFDSLFEHGFEMPLQTRSFENDDVFVYEQTSITGRFTKQLFTLPEEMTGLLTDEHIRGLLPEGVATLNEALDLGLVYGADFSHFDQLENAILTAPLRAAIPAVNQTKYIPGAISLLILHKATPAALAKLTPLAIWVGGATNQVYTPNDNEVDWLLAKLVVSTTSKTMLHVGNILHDQMLLVPHIVAMERNLGPQHPVYVLLKHHSYLGIGSNEYMKRRLLTPSATDPTSFDQVMGIGSLNLQQLVQR